MAYAAGTITNADPWNALSGVIQGLFGGSGVANWSFVETIPAGTGAGQSGSASYVVDVFKCLGSSTDANSAATDFYIALARPTPASNTNGAMFAAEGYDSTDKKFKRQSPLNTVTTAPTGAGYWHNDTYNTWNACSKTSNAATLNTTGFNYWVKLTNDMLCFGVYVGTATYGWYFGLLDSVATVTDSVPLFTGGIGMAASFHALPSVSTSGISSMWSAQGRAWTAGVRLAVLTNATNKQDLWLGGKIQVARGFVCTVSTSNPDTTGWGRGFLKPEIRCIWNGGTVVPGDTMVIDGVTWVVWGSGTLGSSGDNLHWLMETE